MTRRSGVSLKLVDRDDARGQTTDRRRNRRSSVVWAAQVILDAQDKVEAAVLNLSLRGAKLRLTAQTALPEAFILHFAKFGPVAVRLLGQNGREARVAFLHDADRSRQLFGATLPLD